MKNNRMFQNGIYSQYVALGINKNKHASAQIDTAVYNDGYYPLFLFSFVGGVSDVKAAADGPEVPSRGPQVKHTEILETCSCLSVLIQLF